MNEPLPYCPRSCLVMARKISASSASPISWWLLALSMAIFGGASGSWMVQLLVGTTALLMVLALREDAPWSRSVRFYLVLGVFVVVARVVFRIVFNIPNPNDKTLISLPELTMDLGLGPPVTFFGNVGSGALMSGFTDGLRLAAIIVSIGMAASLANPRRLLKSTPSALYEIASSVSVAINLAPQLIASLQRVNRARSLRGRSKGLGKMAGTVIPVLEDAIESSLALAASMDSRGFGRRGELSRLELISARVSSLAAVALLVIGSFLLLTGGPRPAALIVIGTGLAATIATIRLNSKSQIRTRYQPETFGPVDFALWVVSIALIASVALGWSK